MYRTMSIITCDIIIYYARQIFVLSISKYCQSQWRLEKSGDSPTHLPQTHICPGWDQHQQTTVRGRGKETEQLFRGFPPSLSTPLFIPGPIVTPAEKRAATTTVQYNCTQTQRGPGRHLQPALAPETQYWVDTAFYSPCVIASSFCMCVH